MLGLRYAFTQPHQANWMTDGTMDWLWPAAEKAGIPIALMASNYLPQVGQIAERHPGLKLLIDHYARVRDGKDDAAHGNQPALLALAKHPNVAVKCTGAPGNSSQPYPYRNIHKYTQQIVEAFGPQRSFWGTDITRMPCSWKQCVTMFTEEMPWLKGPRPRTGHGPRACATGSAGNCRAEPSTGARGLRQRQHRLPAQGLGGQAGRLHVDFGLRDAVEFGSQPRLAPKPRAAV